MTGDPQEGFARRWSRLKRQPSLPVDAPAPPPAVRAEQPAPVEMPPDAATIPLDDITGWLGRNVPEGWRELALRRLWSADIAIRDFIGPADYAWDWNTPGGAPGWGPMRAADDMVRLLARAIGEDIPKQDPPARLAEIEAPAGLPQDPAPDTVEPEPAVEPPVDETRHDVKPRPITPRRGGRAAPV